MTKREAETIVATIAESCPGWLASVVRQQHLGWVASVAYPGMVGAYVLVGPTHARAWIAEHGYEPAAPVVLR